MNIRFTIFWIAILTFSLSGCFLRKQVYSEPEILDKLENRLTPDELAELEIPFKASPEMISFAERVTRGHVSNVKKALAIVDAIMSKWELDVTYDQNIDLAAIEAFNSGKANCLTFTNLFVSLSRAVGMETVYVDVPQLEEEILQGNIIVNNGHICAGLHDGAQFYLIDFSSSPEKHYRIYREMDDIEAMANHYNNKAYRYYAKSLQDPEKAIFYYQFATRIKPDFSKAYNNLGVTFHLKGETEKAMETYNLALKHEPEMSEATFNLGSLNFGQSNFKAAIQYFSRAVNERPKNAFYHYAIGLSYYFDGEMQKSYKHFKAATKYDPEFAKAYLGLGMLTSQSDQTAEALEFFRKAVESDSTLHAAQIYHDTLIEKIILETL